MYTSIVIALAGVAAVIAAFGDFGQKLELAGEVCMQQSELSYCDGFICKLLFGDDDTHQSDISAPYKRAGVAAPRHLPVKGFLRFGRRRRSATEISEAKRAAPKVKSFIRWGRSRASSLHGLSEDRAADRCTRVENLLIEFLESRVEEKPSVSELAGN